MGASGQTDPTRAEAHKKNGGGWALFTLGVVVAEMELAGVGEGRLLASQSVREKERKDHWFSQELLEIVFLKWCDSRLRFLLWTSLCQ